MKLGANGATACVSDTLLRQPAFPVDVIDPVGAGDAFVGAYLAEHLAGEDPKACLATAALAGALLCTVRGDWEGMPTRGTQLLGVGARRGRTALIKPTRGNRRRSARRAPRTADIGRWPVRSAWRVSRVRQCCQAVAGAKPRRPCHCLQLPLDRGHLETGS
ncbi:carbohydrate kinase family protein [Streptomyces sp. NBC_00118]|uniref:carbohydrate kinase family protein n=1 Tax=Streptomyces sp. NBC_00118 TaxID=2975658 RepID=UPI00308D9721|nr:PfkB family carbohydrate kinase [Streptomyces sp. NBC_01397]